MRPHLLPLLVATAGCPAPLSDTHAGHDTAIEPDSDSDWDSDTARFGLSQRLDPGDCVPWAGTPPDLLSRTGCVDTADPSLPAAGLMPYTVNAPLWSDGAEKARYLALPVDSQATITPDGDLDLPIGTVLAKWFFDADTLIEVRLFTRTASAWTGASWRWDADANDGMLVASGASLTLSSGLVWDIPSMGQCRQCHTQAAGDSLGLEVGQLDGELLYPSGVRANQLDTLVHLGVLPPSLPDVPTLVDPVGGASVDERARSYLHANCSGCHRPSGGTPYTMDLRFHTALQDADWCDVAASNSLGLSDMKRIAPADVPHSMVHLRMTSPDLRMPPLGTNLVDDDASDLVADWINSLPGCSGAE